jgi:hypothetical protein
MTEANALLDSIAPVIHGEPPVPEVPAVEPEPELKILNLTQKRLDEIIVDAMKRSGRSAKDEAAALKLENERLKAQVVGGSPDSTEVERLRAAVADGALRAEAAERKATEQSKGILQARLAQTIDSIDGDSTTKLLRDNLTWNPTSKSFDVLDDNGVIREGITPEVLYTEFAQTHPWSIRGRTLSGGGGTGSVGGLVRPAGFTAEQLFGPTSNAALANRLSLSRDPHERSQYSRLRSEAKQKGLI